jgi:hypothetical protein
LIHRNRTPECTQRLPNLDITSTDLPRVTTTKREKKKEKKKRMKGNKIAGERTREKKERGKGEEKI